MKEWLSSGMKLKFMHKRNNLIGKKIKFFPTFFKYTVYKGRPLLQVDTIIERMLIPWNKKYNNTREVRDFLRNLMPSLGHPATSCIPFYLYYSYINNLLRKDGERQYTIKDAMKLHCNIFEKLINKPQILRNYYKWKSKNYLTKKMSDFKKQMKLKQEVNKIKSLRNLKDINLIFNVN